MTALVVDDSAVMRTVIVGMLRELGFGHVDEAESGAHALEKIRSQHFSIIISDWNMEPMDGLALLRHVRHLQTADQNRFIFATSERSYSHQTSARVDGADEFISKPFTIAQLKAKLDRVIARSRTP